MMRFKTILVTAILLIMVNFEGILIAQYSTQFANRGLTGSIGFKLQNLNLDIQQRESFVTNAPSPIGAKKDYSGMGTVFTLPVTIYYEPWPINFVTIGFQHMNMDIASGSGVYLGIGKRAPFLKDRFFYRVSIEYHFNFTMIKSMEYIHPEKNTLYKNGHWSNSAFFTQLAFGIDYELKESESTPIVTFELGYDFFGKLDSWYYKTGSSTSYYSDQYGFYSVDGTEDIPSENVRYKINNMGGFFVNFGLSMYFDF